MKPDKAFILAAGLGTRMRPLTDEIPKPMVRLMGRTLIDHTLDRLKSAGVIDVTVNLHHKADVLRTHLEQRKNPTIHFSEEPELLDTGGGIKKALANFGNDAFYVLSGDSYWQDTSDENALAALAKAWNPAAMDILILLQEVKSMKVTPGVGDYYLEPEGRAIRSYDRSGPYMFTSIRINAPHIFTAKAGNVPFSYLDLLDTAQKRGRLYGIVHKGAWHHLSTPRDLAAVETLIAQQNDR